MIEPSIPADEEERLATLDRYQILDTPEEAGFDGLTQLAAHLLEVPIALVSLVDGTRQWFKAHHGLDARETPRAMSFCGHVVASGLALTVEDATLDERFHDNPLVVGEPRVRFYAAVPLRGDNGHVIGTLCAIDRVPRRLTAVQHTQLAILADQVVAQLEVRRQARRLAEKRAALEVNAAELRKSEARLVAIFESISDGVVVSDRPGELTACNAAAARILGRTRDDLLSSTPGGWVPQVFREDGTPFEEDARPARVAFATGRAAKDLVIGVTKPSGEMVWISLNVQPLVRDGETSPHEVVATFRDVSLQHEAARRVREALAHKETMLREVHHRVKNNLQVIAALLFFARKKAPDPAQAQVFVELEAHLHGMMLIHERLCSAADQEVVEVGAFLRALLDHFQQLYPGDAVTMALHPCDLSLPLEQILPCGLLVSEMLTNAFKHAFPGGRTGTIAVGLREACGWVTLSVRDDGIGLPGLAHRDEARGFGLPMMRKLADQLAGTLAIDARGGTHVEVTFKLRELQ